MPDGCDLIDIVYPVDEAQISAKVFSPIVVSETPVPVAIVVLIFDDQTVVAELCGLTVIVLNLLWIFGFRVHCLKVNGVLFCWPQCGVEAADPVTISVALAVCNQCANGRILENIKAIAGDGHIALLICERCNS